jgi:hypothetical protein
LAVSFAVLLAVFFAVLFAIVSTRVLSLMVAFTDQFVFVKDLIDKLFKEAVVLCNRTCIILSAGLELCGRLAHV